MEIVKTSEKVLIWLHRTNRTQQWLAEQFGILMDKEPLFVNDPQPNALLNNASKAHKLFGYPRVTVRNMIEMTVSWLQGGGKMINKPTHFQERKGQF